MEDDLSRFSLFVYVSNSPSHLTERELWNICGKVGTLADVYIAKRKNHLGKMFAFCRYIKVSNSKNLIDSLSNVWIGKLRLHANVARFDRNIKSVKPSHDGQKDANIAQTNKVHEGSAKNLDTNNTTFAFVLNVGRRNTNVTADLHPTIVLDEACFMECGFSCSLMGKIKDINALPNLYLILSNEGFENVTVTHLGGMWVLLDMASTTTKDKIHKHVGEIIDVDEPECMTLSFKKLCVKVKSHVTINDKVKVIVKGEVFWIHIKELEPWIPKFTEVKDDDSSSEDEIDGEDKVNQSDSVMDNDDEVDHMSEASCMNEYGNDRMPKKAPSVNEQAASVNSDDPFGIYMILKRDITKVASESVDPQFPPGFTPDVAEVNVVEDANPIPINVAEVNDVPNNNKGSATSGYNGIPKLKSGGSLLEVMDEMIKVGQIMGYNMDGYMHNIEAIIGAQGDEAKMETMDLVSIKALWGNSSFDYVFSPSVGFSGGILCVWDPSIFIKVSHTISDYFVAIRGNWIASSTKLRIISVYAPQELTEKRELWDFLHRMIDSWDGDCILMGDFNEVRTEHERVLQTEFKNFTRGVNAFMEIAMLKMLISRTVNERTDGELMDGYLEPIKKAFIRPPKNSVTMIKTGAMRLAVASA
ncbi:RNA-directed DNA polymerase, eukaryota [Tanacetum coccineum]